MNFCIDPYGEDTNSSEYIVSKRINKFVNIIGGLKGKKVLDYGCGSGGYSIQMAKMGANVIGIDIDKKKIDLAQQEEISYCRFILGDTTKINERYDIVFLNEVIEHFVEFERIFKDLVYSLNHEGSMIIYAPNRWYPFEQHGMQIFNYQCGNKFPFMTYLPYRISKYFITFYARQYRYKDFVNLAKKFNLIIIYHSYISPPCDRISHKYGIDLGYIRKILEFIENIPILKMFLMSHLIILKKK